MPEEFDPKAMTERFAERARAVKDRGIPPIEGPERQAFFASWRRMSGSGATTLCATRLRATTVPSSSTASALTDVVPMSTPTVTGRPEGLTNLTRVSWSGHYGRRPPAKENKDA